MSKHDQWYVRIGGKTHGPFTSQQLRVQTASGRVTPTTKVRPGKAGEWVDAIKVRGLFPTKRRVEPARSRPSTPEPPAIETEPEPVAPIEPPVLPDVVAPPEVADQPPANPDPSGHSHGAAATVLGVMAFLTFIVPLLGLVFAALAARIGYRGRRLAKRADVEPSGLIFSGRWLAWIAGAMAAIVTFAWVIVLLRGAVEFSNATSGPPKVERQLREDW